MHKRCEIARHPAVGTKKNFYQAAVICPLRVRANVADDGAAMAVVTHVATPQRSKELYGSNDTAAEK